MWGTGWGVGSLLALAQTQILQLYTMHLRDLCNEGVTVHQTLSLVHLGRVGEGMFSWEVQSRGSGTMNHSSWMARPAYLHTCVCTAGSQRQVLSFRSLKKTLTMAQAIAPRCIKSICKGLYQLTGGHSIPIQGPSVCQRRRPALCRPGAHSRQQ